MEKTISPEERIRRAEEIYYRRRLNNNVRMSSSQVTEGTRNRQFALYKKMALQILICILIYLIFSLIKDANYLFSEDIINKAKEFLSTDINFQAISENTQNFFKDNQDKFSFLSEWLKEDNEEQNANENNQNEQTENSENAENQNSETQNNESANANEQAEENKINENGQSNQNEQTGSQTSQNNEETGIGGANTNEQAVTASSNSSSSKKTQMEIDAEYIKENFSMVLPAKATITSHYGKREPTEIVSENHQGIDIGVVTGTTIVAAMEGEVSTVSDKGDYGTHVKIVNKDVTTIYAHCSKILVKEGQNVKKGEKIALSGNTGNTTGPHLHFEIRRSERTVDPELLLTW